MRRSFKLLFFLKKKQSKSFCKFPQKNNNNEKEAGKKNYCLMIEFFFKEEDIEHKENIKIRIRTPLFFVNSM